MSNRLAISARIATALLVLWLIKPLAWGQVFSTPEQAAVDPDFRVQGEYAGANKAMQVIARGDGDFEIVVYEGGLPGAGWDKQPPRRVDGDEDVVAQLVDSMGLTRVERTSPTLGAEPPLGAVVLFDGSEESLQTNWEEGAKRTDDGLLMQGATTRQAFGDYRLHIEFQTPFMPHASGQGRGNSGVYHQGRYETQVLDSFGLQGKNNETGGIYSVSDPSMNLCLPPLTWQTYDVEFTAAKFDASGHKISPARLTVRLNGVVVQSNVPVPQPTTAAIRPENAESGPLHLQDHGNPVRYRNIWLAPRDIQRESRRPISAGFERFYAGTDDTSLAAGNVLADSLGCAACHYDTRPDKALAVFGPDLSDVAGRVRHEHLVDFIASPHQTKSGTVMPDLWSGKTETQRREAANAIAQFLVSDRPAPLESVGDQSAANRGQNLYHQVGCVACHTPFSQSDGQAIDQADSVPGSVPLGDLAAKYTLESLTKFLADPLAVRSHGRMPRLAENAAEARDLATYLLKDLVVVESKETVRRRLYRGTWDRLPDFQSLDAVADTRVNDIEINSIEFKENFGVVFDGYLDIPADGRYRFRLASDDGARILVDGKAVVDHDGIHPASEKGGDANLSKGIVPVRVEYFEAGGQEELRVVVDTPFSGTIPLATLISTEPTGRQPISLVQSGFKSEPSLVDLGRQLFVSIGCAQCHQVAGNSDLRWDRGAGELAKLRPNEGCLALDPTRAKSTSDGRTIPDYSLTDGQRQSLGSLIGAEQKSLSDEESIRHRLVTLNCYACHVRDAIGGPETPRRDYFESTTPEMGDEGRLPPILTGVGDKLNDRYLVKVLDQGANQRPYMKTRMPAFGVHTTADLAQWLIEVDRRDLTPGIANTTADVDQAAFQHQQLTDGRTLAGNDGLACIKCHTFGGVGLSGIQAIDALLMPERLREDWFHRYLMDPQKYRPGTRMPASFPDGKSVVTKIADGRPHEQAAALWAYFSQGKDAKTPIGLYPNAIELRAISRPVIYRNFLTGLSPRGIGVGYPEGINIGWDSQRMMLAKVWKNAFIDASKHWIGRGPGAQEPLGDAVITIDRATPVARIEPGAVWPNNDAMKDSLKFLGYRLDSQGRPAFRYSVDDLVVQQSIQPIGSDSSPKSFQRSFAVTGRGLVTILLAAGQVELSQSDATEPATYKIDNAYSTTAQGGKIDRVRSGDRDELRAMIDLGPSESTVVVTQKITW